MNGISENDPNSANGSSALHQRRQNNGNSSSAVNESAPSSMKRRKARSQPLVIRKSSKKSSKHTSASPYQSQSFEPDESEVWRAYVAHQHYKHRGDWLSSSQKKEGKRWMVCFMIGVVQSLLALLCNIIIRYLVQKKFDSVYTLMHRHQDVYWTPEEELLVVKEDDRSDDTVIGDGTYDHKFYAFGGRPFFTYLFFQIVFAFIATMFVWIEPAAGGSGIPEIKCLLNGINMPGLVELKTLVCKLLGVCFSVAAGLPVGKEGPMFHSGAIVAAIISQGRSKIRNFDINITTLADLRNPWEKRDFIACGAAAGIASAFSSPIGGVLLSLEEGSSFWSTKLTWRAFFCAMISLLTLLTIKTLDINLGQAEVNKFFTLGEFTKVVKGQSSFSIWELLIFMVIGCIGGLLGALFNAICEHLTKWRIKHINYSKKLRMLEVMLLSVFMSVWYYCLPLIWKKCTELPTNIDSLPEQEQKLIDALVPFNCIPGKEYNEVASLIFTDADTAIKQLLHFRDDGNSFSSASLFIFFITYFIMVAIFYGTAVPAGLFIPALLSGAAFGRLCGHLLQKITTITFANTATYALIGAAAVLGGKARMTISLTVILLEASGDMEYVLPLMLTLMAARFTGNIFNEGIYDISIHLKHVPFLEPDVPHVIEKEDMVAGQVMSTDVKCLRLVERAGVVYDLLKACSHATFPIVDMADTGTLYGTVSRDVLCTLLQRRAFGSTDMMNEIDDGGIVIGPKRLSPLVQWSTIMRSYPQFPTINEVDMLPSDRDRLLDLRPYANTAPYTINETASIQRTYRLFRMLGLRFLCVVNNNNQIAGMITRKDLLTESLSRSLMRGRLDSNGEEEHTMT